MVADCMNDRRTQRPHERGWRTLPVSFISDSFWKSICADYRERERERESERASA